MHSSLGVLQLARMVMEVNVNTPGSRQDGQGLGPARPSVWMSWYKVWDELGEVPKEERQEDRPFYIQEWKPSMVVHVLPLPRQPVQAALLVDILELEGHVHVGKTSCVGPLTLCKPNHLARLAKHPHHRQSGWVLHQPFIRECSIDNEDGP